MSVAKGYIVRRTRRNGLLEESPAMPVHALVILHREGENSPESLAASKALRNNGLDFGPLEKRTCYLLEGLVSDANVATAVAALKDPVLESIRVEVGGVSAPETGTQLLVLRRSGVMDPVEASVQTVLRRASVDVAAVKVAHAYVFRRLLRDTEAAAAARALANDVIEETHVGALTLASLRIGHGCAFQRADAPIRDLDDAGLRRLNGKHGLSLNAAELRAVRDFFRELGREPTDVEIEMVAQTWSEHCKHKTLTGPIRYRDAPDAEPALADLAPEVVPANGDIDGLLQSTIKRATDEICAESPDKAEFCWSVFVDNAGIVRFDDEHGICVKVETHNHPSAIEPYGGAGTGIGGVIRDILGTGLGAKPIANTDVFCFGYPDMKAEDVPRGALHPLRTLRGVVAGVRDYGNRMGIPTVNGAVHFDERYTGNPLVYAGSIGLIPRAAVNKRARPGDRVVAVGGRTGRDGIGGATFSSAELTEESETLSSGAVQIGNPITEKMVLDTMLRARDLGLYTCVTDCGAGGFSSAVGEMGELTGARIELTNAPLKYQGLSYREIWLSEAQERMVFAVPPDKLDAFLALFHAEDVETAVLGEFTADKRMVVHYAGNTVIDLPMSFLHDGLPRVEREALWATPAASPSSPGRVSPDQCGEVLKAILASADVCSKEWVIRQYDHEVQAMSALKPLVGARNDGPSDAAALVPRPGHSGAVVVGCGLKPRYGDIDPYWMALASIDEALRNVVCAGGDPERCAILDNFSWGNCDKPDRLGGLVRAAAACYVGAKAYGTPFISGKDSLNNEFATEAGTIAIPPTLLITAVAMTDVDFITSMDLKAAGNRLFQIGLTFNEFGASHFNLVTGQGGGAVPRCAPTAARSSYRALHEAMQAGLVRAAHDCSEGGLAVALAEMAFAGGFGADMTLVPDLAAEGAARDNRALLFSESCSRIVIEVHPKDENNLRRLFDGLPLTPIGRVSDHGQLKIGGLAGEPLLDEDIEELRMIWKSPLYRAMGEEVPDDGSVGK